jgi:hypothetical protein
MLPLLIVIRDVVASGLFVLIVTLGIILAAHVAREDRP